MLPDHYLGMSYTILCQHVIPPLFCCFWLRLLGIANYLHYSAIWFVSVQSLTLSSNKHIFEVAQLETPYQARTWAF